MTAVEVRLFEWSTIDPSQPSGACLRGRRLSDGLARELASTLARQRILEVTELYSGMSIRARSHVGRIQLGDLTVTIMPKIPARELLALLRYTYGFRDLHVVGTADFTDGEELFADLIVAQLHAEVSELFDRGLHRRYKDHADDLAAPRGRLDMNRLASRYASVAGVLPCRYHERTSNVFLNQLLRAGVALAARMASDSRLRNDVSRLEASLQTMASAVPLSLALFGDAKRSMNRLVIPYAAPVRLIELLYLGASITLDDGSSFPLPGFLFDMNRFFQALIERFLCEYLQDFEIRAEHALQYMMGYVAGSNPHGRRAPRPRPDFMVLEGQRIVQILDAKYRDLWAHELPRDMLYQLSVYALSQPERSTAAILYPTSTTVASEAVIEIREPASGAARAFVALRPVVLQQLLEVVQSDQHSQGVELARLLAFGNPMLGSAVA